MSVETVHELLGWCTLINVAILALWGAFFFLAHDWMYRLHGGIFKFSVKTFDAIHYTTMAVYKIGIFLFNLVPYVALSMMI